MKILKCIWRIFGDFWCFFVHGFLLDKHEMKVRYGDYTCKKCGRTWPMFII